MAFYWDSKRHTSDRNTTFLTNFKSLLQSMNTLELLIEMALRNFEYEQNNIISLNLGIRMAEPFSVKLPRKIQPEADTWYGNFQPECLKFGRN